MKTLEAIRTATVFTNGAADRGMCGFTRDDVIERVAGFRISTANGAIKLENLHTRELGSKIDDGSVFVFALEHNEHVVRVDACVSADAINAVCFHTNQRVSDWYGGETGEVRTLEADAGYCINAFQTTYGLSGRPIRVRLTQLRAIFVSLTAINDAFLRDVDPAVTTERSPIFNGGQLVSFDSLSGIRLPHQLPPRAVLIDAHNWITSIQVLSASEYDRYLAGSHLFLRHPSESVLELVENEFILATGVSMVCGKLAAICFKTNQRTSPWFGRDDAGEPTWWDCETRPGASICGLQLQVVKDSIRGVGVIYSMPAPDAKTPSSVTVSNAA